MIPLALNQTTMWTGTLLKIGNLTCVTLALPRRAGVMLKHEYGKYCGVMIVQATPTPTPAKTVQRRCKDGLTNSNNDIK
jgi:hypothetical protein